MKPIARYAWSCGLVVLLAAALGCSKESRDKKDDGAGGGRGGIRGEEVVRTSGPLAALVPIGVRLEKGLNAILTGNERAAFGDWRFEGDPKLAKDLASAGAREIRLVGFELELMFGEGDAGYYLRTFVHPSARASVFIGIEGRGTTSMSGTPLGDLKGSGAPLAEAARAIVAAATVGCSLPIAEESLLDALAITGNARDEGKKMLVKTRAAKATVCSEIAAQAGKVVAVRVDDVAAVVLGKDGELVGSIKSELGIADDGTLALELGRFKPGPLN